MPEHCGQLRTAYHVIKAITISIFSLGPGKLDTYLVIFPLIMIHIKVRLNNHVHEYVYTAFCNHNVEHVRRTSLIPDFVLILCLIDYDFKLSFDKDFLLSLKISFQNGAGVCSNCELITVLSHNKHT